MTGSKTRKKKQKVKVVFCSERAQTVGKAVDMESLAISYGCGLCKRVRESGVRIVGTDTVPTRLGASFPCNTHTWSQ